MDLEETLDKIVELAREELHIVRKRAQEKTPARDHGKDYHEAQAAADRLDHYAHQLYRLHDAEYADGWRHHSAGDRNDLSGSLGQELPANSESGIARAIAS